MTRMVAHGFLVFGLAVAACRAAEAQWDFGAEIGIGTSHDPSLTSPGGSAQSGFRTMATASVVWAENPYQYIGGEFRYMFRWGGPKLTSNGTQASMDGYANVITYDLLVHLKSRESRVRPYVAAGSGIKIYTGTAQRFSSQPLSDIAVLVPGTQVEPVISTGGGLKYLLRPGLQIRLDFRTHMTPLPNDLIRPTGRSVIHGW